MVNKNELIDALAPRLGGRAAAALAVEALVDVVLRQVAAGGSVGVTGFGTFEPVDRAPRTGRNPHTGQAVPIPATRTPRFRPGTYFKAVVADPDLLPSDGLAGARVGSADEGGSGGPGPARPEQGGDTGVPSDPSGGPGAPATIRRPADGADRGPAPGRKQGESAEETSTGRRVSGTPATVRADRPRSAPLLEAEPTHVPGTGGLTIGGEQITREMISAKKAQLARAKQDEDTPGQGAGGRKGRAAGDAKDGASAKKKKNKGRKKGKGKGRKGRTS